MGIVNELLVAAQLAFGRRPNLQWISDPDLYTYGPGDWDLSTPSGSNPNATPGISVVDAVTAQVVLSAKYRVGQKSAFFTIPLFDAATTYSITLVTADQPAGFAYTSVGQASAQAAVQEIADAIQADLSATDGTSATVIAGRSGVQDTILISAPEDAGAGTPSLFTVTASSATGGTGTQEVYVDATNTGARVWAKIRNPNNYGLLPAGMDTPWTIPTDPSTKEPWDLSGLGGYGRSAVFDVAAYDRLYVELFNITGDAADVGAVWRPYLLIGTAVLED